MGYLMCHEDTFLVDPPGFSIVEDSFILKSTFLGHNHEPTSAEGIEWESILKTSCLFLIKYAHAL